MKVLLKKIDTKSQKNKYYENGIDENLSIDKSMHSLFGCSKLSADIMVQEFGRLYKMKTVCFRGGCLYRTDAKWS